MATRTSAPKRASTSRKRAVNKKATADLAVAMILDRSSSMSGLTDAVIDGFNEYVSELRDQEGETFLTLTVFSDDHEFVYEGKPLDKVTDLTRETYSPYGNTALYDSIAATVEQVERNLKAAKREKDTKVLIVTITDGYENHSCEHTAASLADLVRAYEKKGNYTFVYLGLGQTRDYVASAAVAGMGYVGDNGYYPLATNAGVSSSFASLSLGSNSLRNSTKRSSQNLMADAGVVMPGVGDDPVAAVQPGDVLDAVGGKTERSLLDVLTGGGGS